MVLPASWIKPLIYLTLLAGVFGAGYLSGSSRVETKYVRMESKTLLKWAETVTSLSTAFTALAESTTRERVEVRWQTKVVTKEVVKYVETMDKADIAKFELPGPVFDLRLCAVDQLYKAARAELPGERVGAACPSAVP